MTAPIGPSGTDPIVLTGADLTVADVEAVARHRARVELDAAARARMQEARDVVERLVAAGEVVYGVTTGFGALATRFVPPEDAARLQENLLRSHAAGVGAPLPVEVVRAITGHQPTTTTSLQDLAGPWLVIDAAMAVCLAPICEEVYFRGFVFQGLRGRMRFVWAALLSGGFFAFVHVEPIRFFGLALMGVILAAVFEHRRTLVASMAAHATINVIAILALLATR